MGISGKQLKGRKEACVRLACEIVRLRDCGCQFCGTERGPLDPAHVIPRSRGFDFACDPDNILLLCRKCHATWHTRSEWGYEMLAEKRPDIYDYVENNRYRPPVKIARRHVDETYVRLLEMKKEAEAWNRLQV